MKYGHQALDGPRILLVLVAMLPVALSADPASGFQRLMDEIDALRMEHDVPAVVLTLVGKDGPVMSEARGMADRESGRSATPDTLFRIGSITKTFTALLAVMLQEQGRLRLNAPVTALAADIPLTNPWAPTRPVRLAHLLEHTAGLLDISKAEFDFNEPVTLEEGLAFAPESRVCQWPPGLHSSYSNAGYGLAGFVIEQVTERRWEELIGEDLFKPLGMRSASLELDQRTRERLATGYDSDGVTVIPYWHMIFRPFGAINASPREMAALIQLFLNEGRINNRTLLSKTAIRRMEQPATTLAAQDGLTYGYGLGLYAFFHEGLLFHGHGGDGDGYLSHFAYNRESGQGYFIVINAFQGKALRKMRHLVQDYIVSSMDPPPPPKVMVDAHVLRELAGTYEKVTWRFPWNRSHSGASDRLRVVWQDGSLHTQKGAGELRPLIPVTSRHFRRPHEPAATIAFVLYDGTRYLQGDLGNYREIGLEVGVSTALIDH